MKRIGFKIKHAFKKELSKQMLSDPKALLGMWYRYEKPKSPDEILYKRGCT